MKLNFSGIRDAGLLASERVVMKAEGEGNIGRYLLVSSHALGENSVSSKIIAPLWFPDKTVKDGDTVVVYTKAGSATVIKNDDETNSFFYYLGVSTPLYAQSESCAVLIEVGRWDSSQKRY